VAVRKRPQLNLATVRSAVTNGRYLFREIDGRSAWMRRYRDLINLHTSDLGGADLVSEAEKRLISRAAMLSIQLELMDVRFAENEGEANRFDLDTYQRLTNTLRRTLESLGLQRRARDVTPSVSDYVKHLNEQEEADA
jgi:hypothetical protein